MDVYRDLIDIHPYFSFLHLHIFLSVTCVWHVENFRMKIDK